MRKPFTEILGYGSENSSRNLALLVVLVAAIVVLPGFDQFTWLVDVVTAIVLLSCIRSISGTRRSAMVAWGLGVFPVLGLLLGDFAPALILTLGRVLTLPFFAYTVIVLLRALLSARVAGPAELYGAASTYLLIGMTWGLVFVVLELFHPGSFSFPDHDTQSGSSLFYFSYVTLVTLGYGEITPVSDVARSLSIIEAIMGSLFLAMLVARLVGLFTSAQMQEFEKERDRDSVDP